MRSTGRNPILASYSVRILPLGLTAVLVAAVVLYPAVAPAPTQMGQTERISESKETKTPRSYAVDIAAIRIELDEDHRFGTGLSTEEIQKLAQKTESIPAFCKEMQEYGEVAVFQQSEATGLLGSNLQFTSGVEEPHIATTSAGPRGPGFSSMNLSSGLTATITLREESAGSIPVNYDVNLDDSMIINVSTGEESTANLVRRNRMTWDGTCTFALEGGVFALKTLRGSGDQPYEYLAILRLKPVGPSED